MTRIVAAVSPGDAYYQEVLRTAHRLAQGSRVTLLSIHPSPIEWVTDQVRSAESRTLDARRKVAHRIQADAATLELTGVEVVVPLARNANVGADIVEQAGELGATLIVVGTHGRKGLSALVLGSVAQHVVRHSACDVYVVRHKN